MKQELRERLGRLGPIRVIPRVPFGSPAVVTLRVAGELGKVNTVLVAHALIRRGVDGKLALAVIDEMVVNGEAVVQAPVVEPGDGLADDLRAAGIEPVVAMEKVPA